MCISCKEYWLGSLDDKQVPTISLHEHIFKASKDASFSTWMNEWILPSYNENLSPQSEIKKVPWVWDPREDFPLCDEEFSSRQGAETLIHDDKEQRTSPGNTTTPSIISHPRFIFIICLSNVTKTKVPQQIPVLNSTRIILDIEEKGSDNQSEEDCHCYLNRFFLKRHF